MNIDTGTDVGRYEIRLFTDLQFELLYKNGLDNENDHVPVAYLLQNKLHYQWLITELYLHDPDLAYGLSNLNNGKIELGYIDLKSIMDINKSDKIINSPGFYTEDKISLFKALADELGYIPSREEGNADLFKKFRKIIY